MKKILILLITFTFATELEVDGSLKVTGGIDAQGQTITNVGNPVNPSDAIPMSAVSGVVTNAMSLAGMNPPERIYRYVQPNDGSIFSFTVPNGKLWKIELWGGAKSNYSVWLSVNGEIIALAESVSYSNGYGGRTNRDNFNPLTLIDGDVISNEVSNSDYQFTKGGLTIYEYSITSSGTEQGLDYVEP